MKMTNVQRELVAKETITGLARKNNFATPSFWICEDTAENRKTLNKLNVSYSAKSFISADGTRCNLLEFDK